MNIFLNPILCYVPYSLAKRSPLFFIKEQITDTKHTNDQPTKTIEQSASL